MVKAYRIITRNKLVHGFAGLIMEIQMLNRRPLLMLLAFFLCSLAGPAQGFASETLISPAVSADATVRIEPLLSPSVAQEFYEIASELADSKNITGPQAQQAIVFLTAARNLDSAANYVQPLLIKLACRHLGPDYSPQVYRWLENYLDEYSDLEVAKEAISYLLDQSNTREQREQFLAQMLKDFGEKNAVVGSELATLLGLLMAEKGDSQAAQLYLVQAYSKNRYNRLAFAKLAELVPERVSPAMYLDHLRLVLRENPMDIDAALAFAQYAEQLQLYEVAAGGYRYCADLFSYLYPSEPLPVRIYLPWAISSYNTQRNKQKCLEIAQAIRQRGRFDILLEAIAGRAAAKIGDANEAGRIFRAAEQKAQQLLEQGPEPGQAPLAGRSQSSGQQVGARQFAWFYCFAWPDAAKALDWANKAYSTDPNSATAASLLAYALVVNQQMEWAKPLIDNYERNQISSLALAQVQLAQGKKDPAIETLKSAIAKDPGSLAAELAKELLKELGGEYIPPVAPDVILTTLASRFGQMLIPEFVSPEKTLSVQFSIRGSEFSYGSTFGGTVAITNNSDEPLVISDEGLFKGNIRVDANVTGDLTKSIPNLVSREIRTAMLLAPGQGMLTSMRLVTGQLEQILLTYPQASLEVEFTLYIDPVTTSQGKVTNRLADIKPATVVVKRPGIELTSKYLRGQYNSISTSQTGQKIKTAQLFIGLLKEQHAMVEQGALYKFKYADWMPALLKSALLQESGLLLNPVDDDWMVKAHTMAEMLSLPLDHELIAAVAKNLNNPKWPVRMTAIYLLANSPDGSGFDRVLDWAVKYDSSRLVRDMAAALTAARQAAPQPEPANPAEPNVPGELRLIDKQQ